MRSGQTVRAPEVGIVYLVGDRLLIDTTPLAEADNFGDLAFHELDHERWWAQLVTKELAPDTVYTEFPRGRVSFDLRNEEFRFLADECILQDNRLVERILSHMHIPVRETKIGTDSCYRCGYCERRVTAAV